MAGTFSHKPYLFNADNVERYAPKLASPGTVIDRGYDELDCIARGIDAVGREPNADQQGVNVPPLLAAPLELAGDSINAARIAGRRIALVHSWSLTSRPPADVVVGVLHWPFHTCFPWPPTTVAVCPDAYANGGGSRVRWGRRDIGTALYAGPGAALSLLLALLA